MPQTLICLKLYKDTTKIQIPIKKLGYSLGRCIFISTKFLDGANALYTSGNNSTLFYDFNQKERNLILQLDFVSLDNNELHIFYGSFRKSTKLPFQNFSLRLKRFTYILTYEQHRMFACKFQAFISINFTIFLKDKSNKF